MELYNFYEPRAEAIPILIDVPHAGELEPAEVTARCVAAYERRKRDFDLYVDRFWSQSPSLGATMMVARYSRYVLDLNRSAEDVDAASVQAHPNPEGRFRRGLLWQVTAAGEPVLAEPLSQAEYVQRVATYHQPYHAHLQASLEAIRARFGYVVLIDAHSMPSVGRDDHPDPGEHRADIVPGTNQGRSCPASLTAACTEVFEEHGLSVRVDHPYKGGWITRHYGRPQDGIHALQIEVSRRVYMDEESFVINEAGMTRLSEACSAFVKRLSTWRPS
ncbi:MAG: N-formylglutamate amidohydrolase [Myxococcota bacterium]|nr:N-formylglutamate amidohydrolase [Myxococcota bacterium]